MSALPIFHKNGNQSRYTKRQEQRRKIDALVGSDFLEVGRRDPDWDEVGTMLRNIRDNKISEFGLVKLSVINLNDLYSVNENSEPMTLLRYATALGRDRIAVALLRAGALPHTEGSCVSKTCAKDLPAQYIVWLMRYETSRICSGLQCQICHADSAQCIRFDGCQHTACLSCFWSRIHDLDWLKSRIVESATSDITWDGILDPMVCCLVCDQAVNVDRTCNEKRALLFKKTPDDCKQTSYAMYSQLPHSFSSGHSAPKGTSNKATGNKDNHAHSGLHLSEIARCSLGVTRVQRNEELVKACMKGDLRRVAALVESGVDLDCVDEYGMTALMQAAWLGLFHMCALLIAAGADVDIKDALGHTALFIAHSARHDCVEELLFRSYRCQRVDWSLLDGKHKTRRCCSIAYAVSAT